MLLASVLAVLRVQVLGLEQKIGKCRFGMLQEITWTGHLMN